MKAIGIIRGMRDIFPDQASWWRWLESRLDAVMEAFGYGEIRTPLLERTELFARSIGRETDIVEKEMYTFSDRDGSLLTLRPEGTAAVVRSFIENNLSRRQPLHRFYYRGPMFRHERPQKGRYRQFHQVGAELFGSPHPAADVEIIELAQSCLRALGLGETSLELNSQGCAQCRPTYREQLLAYLRGQRARLCSDCQRRLENNPLRVLDCKQQDCRRVAEGAPHMLDHLCPECREHFSQVTAGLQVLGIEYHLNHRLVRGLDYYNRTTFEMLAPGLGAQNAVAGGGRYDGLVESLGGPAIPAVGFAAGLERILLLVSDRVQLPEPAPLLFVACQPELWQQALQLMAELRRAGLRASADLRLGSFKAQLKRADREGARLVLLLGEDEMAAAQVTIKDLRAASPSDEKQVRVPRQQLFAYLERFLGGGRSGGEEG